MSFEGDSSLNLTEGDKQIFCTSLNKLDNDRAREISQSFSSGDGFKEILENQEIVERLRQRLHFLKNTTITLGDDKYLHGQQVAQKTLQSILGEEK